MQLTTELVAELLDPARQPVVGAALEVEALQRVPPVGIKPCIVQTANLQDCNQKAETCLCDLMLVTSECRPPAPPSISSWQSTPACCMSYKQWQSAACMYSCVCMYRCLFDCLAGESSLVHIAVTEAPSTNLRGKFTACKCGVQGFASAKLLPGCQVICSYCRQLMLQRQRPT